MINRAHKIISLIVMTAILLSSALAQGQKQQKASPKTNSQTAAAQGGNTPGRIAKFTTTKAVGDSNITEDGSGNIGVGTTLPTSPLTVNGVIEMIGQGGIKFPDGTIQTTAGLATISHDSTLKGDGTQASRLGVQAPLHLFTPSSGTTLTVSNSGVNGFGLWAFGGPAGVAVRAHGATGSLGLEAAGGQKDGGDAGDGIRAFGGGSNDGNGGTAVFAVGGSALVNDNVPDNRAGHGIEAFAGFRFSAIKGFAGKFNGDVLVTGVLSKAGGSFKIDHPLDPENKYLSHSFVESPDMKNIYDGVVSLDGNGEAIVEMPEWFSALNRDFRYLLTAIGAPMPGLYIAEEITNNRFRISGGMAGMKVSWQVTGVRQDAWANKNRIPVEEAKSERERGHYLHPEAFGKDEERDVEWANRPELMREMKERRIKAEQNRPRQR
jgi:hypothetical protein